MLHAFGGPIAAPSANLSGTVTATTARHVWESLGGGADLILDGGPTTHGLESTIVGLFGSEAVLLRPGAVAREEIERIAGPLMQGSDRENAPHSPGRLRSHYATAAPLRLILPAGSEDFVSAPSSRPCSSTIPSPQTMTTFF